MGVIRSTPAHRYFGSDTVLRFDQLWETTRDENWIRHIRFISICNHWNLCLENYQFTVTCKSNCTTRWYIFIFNSSIFLVPNLPFMGKTFLISAYFGRIKLLGLTFYIIVIVLFYEQKILIILEWYFEMASKKKNYKKLNFTSL